MGYGKIRVSLMVSAAVLLCSALVSPEADARWADRVLPLPREMSVSGSVEVEAGDISYEIKAEEDAPVYSTARELLGSFAMGGEDGRGKVNISLILTDENPEAVPEPVRRRLAGLPNAEQAYAILYEEGEPLKVTLAANAPVGLLYAAQTLTRLVKPGEGAGEGVLFEIPLVKITDWPAISQRGEWSASGYSSWGLNTRWKLNMFKLRNSLSGREYQRWFIDASRGQEFLDWADELGHILVPYITHLGHLSVGNWEGISPPVLSDEHRARQPGFCWSDDGIHEILGEWMREMTRLVERNAGGYRDIEVWLSEYAGMVCYCEECAGKDNYIHETLGVIDAYEEIRKEYPELRLRILLSQGTHHVKEAIVDLAARYDGIGIGYYDGIRTYYADREELIFPELEEFARAGGLVDVIPVLTPCYHSLYPASMPQYVRFRAKEFADKKLQAVTAFSQRGQFYWPLNIAAWGEYTWNPGGRPVKDFARAYATIEGMAEPQLFARWAEKAGEAAWELANSRYMDEMGRERYFRLPSEVGEDEFQRGHTIRIGRALGYAREALNLARESGDPMMLAESEVTLAALRSIELRHDIQRLLRERGDMEAVSEKLLKVDICGRLIHANIHRWYRHARESQQSLETAPGYLRPPYVIMPLPGELFQGWPANRQYMQARGVLRASDAEWQAALMRGAPDTRGDMAPAEIFEWDEGDFDDGQMFISKDISSIVPLGGGYYNLEINMLVGSCRIRSIEVSFPDAASGAGRVLEFEPGHGRWTDIITIFDRRIKVPARPEGQEVHLEILLGERDGGGGSGYVSLRSAWSREEFPEEEIDMLLR